MARSRANEIDAHVGRAIKIRRSLLGISQEALGEALGLTFQQIQKFETGSNRVSSKYLFQLSRELGVPISYFFAEAVAGEKKPSEGLDPFWASREGLDLWIAFSAIKDDRVRKRALELVQAIAVSRE